MCGPDTNLPTRPGRTYKLSCAPLALVGAKGITTQLPLKTTPNPLIRLAYKNSSSNRLRSPNIWRTNISVSGTHAATHGETTMTANELKSSFPKVVRAAKQLVANPLKTTAQHQRVSELRQEMERRSLGGLLNMACQYVREGKL